MINVTCCFKTGYDLDKVSAEEWRQTANTGHADLGYLKSRIDPQDESGLELALRFRDACEEIGLECNLGAVSAGDRNVTVHLQTLTALGFREADRIVWSDAFAPDGVVSALAKYAKDQESDVIVCGMKSSAGGTGSVPIMLAELLGVKCITNVKEFEPTGEDHLQVTYIRDGLMIREAVPVPVVLAVGDVQRCFLRVPTLRQRLASASVPIGEIMPETKEESAELIGFEVIRQDRESTLVDGSDPAAAAAEIYQRLVQEGVVRV